MNSRPYPPLPPHPSRGPWEIVAGVLCIIIAAGAVTLISALVAGIWNLNREIHGLRYDMQTMRNIQFYRTFGLTNELTNELTNAHVITNGLHKKDYTK